jgi:hypothetical protein
MLCHIECKYVDKNYVNVHIDPFAQFFTHRSATYDKNSSITTAILYEMNSFFELRECIDFNVKFFSKSFSITLIFIIMNLRIKPDELHWI